MAQLYAGLWSRAVTRQHDRVTAGEDDKEGQLLDALIYVLCLRNLMRAADLVHDAVAPQDARVRPRRIMLTCNPSSVSLGHRFDASQVSERCSAKTFTCT